ncbi:hypothetical protein QTO34_012566 [Cnephaeus nilssonii]|uniref:Uncharacterized protein n=1 Tax=Cnephaeus nilssonii TaxID=3371016 RepID=A0AA40HBH1_CNENI|nr:hypothetical protein QTO34_012566 [Eptesicus nilssonii]
MALRTPGGAQTTKHEDQLRSWDLWGGRLLLSVSTSAGTMGLSAAAAAAVVAAADSGSGSCEGTDHLSAGWAHLRHRLAELPMHLVDSFRPDKITTPHIQEDKKENEEGEEEEEERRRRRGGRERGEKEKEKEEEKEKE